MQFPDASGPVNMYPDLYNRARSLAGAAADWLNSDFEPRSQAVTRTLEAPNTFTEASIHAAIDVAMARVTEPDLLRWGVDQDIVEPMKVGVLNAGNIPLVGLQDFLAVTLSGHRYIGVTSRSSPYLLPAFAETVVNYDASIKADFVSFDRVCETADAVIATGSNATIDIVSRRFSNAGIPPDRQLLRGTRLGVALLEGSETDADLFGLARDALLHDGRGCRNVAIIFAREDVDWNRFRRQADRFRTTFRAHDATRAAVERAARLLHAVGESFIDGDGFVLVRDDVALREPCVLRWVTYSNASEPEEWIQRNANLIQVLVSNRIRPASDSEQFDQVGFGMAQDPPLAWCPDGQDTMAFLRKGRVAGL